MIRVLKVVAIFFLLTNVIFATEFELGSVRIWKGDHPSCSGTIIDYRDGEATILTCSHLYLKKNPDEKKKEQVIDTNQNFSVDILGTEEKKVPATVLSYNLKQDVSLMKIKTNKAITFIKVAPVYYSENTGVIATGCEGGGDYKAFPTKILKYDFFIGFRNVLIQGEPKPGRSGGGLFNNRKEVIGVCSSTGIDGRSGIYASLPGIHKLLDDNNLSHFYQK